MDVNKAKEKILELERKIYKLVSGFEDETGLLVEDINLEHQIDVTRRRYGETLSNVDVRVIVPKP